MKSKQLRITLLIFLGTILIMMALAPRLIKNYVVKNSPELIGRQISLEKLKFNFFTSTAKAYQFKIYEANGVDEFISFDTLIVNLEPLKYFQDMIVIEQFYLKGLTTNLIMQDSSFNFDDLIKFHSVKDSSAIIETADTSVFKYAVSNIELRESNVYFDNRNVDKLTTIEGFDFVMPFIGWDQQVKSQADLKFDLKNGGYVQSTFNINPNSGDFDANIELHKFIVDPFYKYVLEYAEIQSMSGSLDATIDITGNTQSALESIVSIKVELFDFEMTDVTDKKFLAAASIMCELHKIDYKNSNYQLGTLEINNSYTFFQLDSSSNNFFRIFKIDEASVAKEKSEETLSMPENKALKKVDELRYGLQHLVVNEGVLDYTDNLTG